MSTTVTVVNASQALSTKTVEHSQFDQTSFQATNKSAFAVVKDDGSVEAWGHSPSGGDNSSVADKLEDGVNEIVSTWHAFAAIKDDGSVVTWGYDDAGGDSTAVAENLQSDVLSIASNEKAFAALKGNGSVVTWGNASHGGDSSEVASDLNDGINRVYAIAHGFAAIKDSDGSVISWGSGDVFGDYVGLPEYSKMSAQFILIALQMLQ